MRILTVSGSLRRQSHNSQLLALAESLALPDLELVRFDGLKEIPPFDEDDEQGPEPNAVASWRAAIRGAQAVLIATPEYNGSIPGQLKNAIDWASRPKGSAVLLGKPAAVIGASTGMFGAVWAQAELRKVLGSAGARVLDAELAIPHAHELVSEGQLAVEADTHATLSEVVGALAEMARARELAHA